MQGRVCLVASQRENALPARFRKAAIRGFDGLGLELDSQFLADRVEDGREIVHARVARVREHPVQALARLRRFHRQRFESHSRVQQARGTVSGRLAGLAKLRLVPYLNEVVHHPLPAVSGLSSGRE
jgi:hypothetical protein